MNRPIGIGLVGYKFMGKAHSNAFARLPMFFPGGAPIAMKALCGRDETGVKEAAVQFGWESAETDYRKLCARDDIDVIDVTAPSDYHKPIVMEALKNGKHVFCEKPLALNLKDAREMRDAAQRAGVKNQIGFNYRFVPALQLAKKLIDEGRIGRVFHWRACYLQDWIIDPSFPMVWRLNRDICGSGSLGDLGAHLIDMAHFLVGDIDSVTGMNETFVKKRPVVASMTGLTGTADADAPLADVTVDDGTIFCCRFKNGALGTFEATRFAAGHKNDMYFELNGDKGSIRFHFERMNELEYCNFEDDDTVGGFRIIQASGGGFPYGDHWWPSGHVIGYEHTFVHEMVEFTRAIAQDTAAVPGFEAGVKVAQVMDAVDLSIDRRAWVDVDSL